MRYAPFVFILIIASPALADPTSARVGTKERERHEFYDVIRNQPTLEKPSRTNCESRGTPSARHTKWSATKSC